MSGGTNNGMKIQGNCLKPSKNIQWSSQKKPYFIQKTPAQDTKVTLITQEEMNIMKSEIDKPLPKQKQSYEMVASGRKWGPLLSKPNWNTTSETFAQSKGKEEPKSLNKGASPPLTQMDDKVNVLYVADSIGSHCDFQLIEEATGVDIITKKAYSSVEDMRAKWPEKNFKDVVPVQLAQGNYNHLVMQAPSVEITNLKNVVNKTCIQYQGGRPQPQVST